MIKVGRLKKTISLFLTALLVVSMWLSNYGITYASADYSEKTEDYESWKESLLSNTGSSTDNRMATVNNQVLSNDYIAISTNASNGRFAMGTTEGNPSIASDNNKKLLFGYPGAGTSYTTFCLDGTENIFESKNGVFDSENQKYTSSTIYGDIEVTQELSIVKNNGTDREDVVQIKYIATNPVGGSEQLLGARIMLDTMLGSNDAAPFRVPGYGNITTETEFVGDEIPQFWQAFDRLTSPGVVSQGRFLSSSYMSPDKVQFTNWSRVYGDAWGYSINPNLNNGDSAVSIIWNEGTILPGETKEFVTYYGMSELVGDLYPPLALAVYADSTLDYGSSNGNALETDVVGYLQNISGVMADNVSVSIILPEGMSLAPGYDRTINIGSIENNREEQLNWKVKLDTSSLQDKYTIRVVVKADGCDEKAVEKTINIHESKKAIFVIPGIMGSNLIDSNNPDELLWLNQSWIGGSKALWQLVMKKLNCNNDGTSVNKNIIPLTDENEYGAQGTYKNLIESLKGKFGDEFDIVFVPYDWRMPLEDGSQRIEDEVKKYDEVSFVAHSMGGLVVEKYIATRGNDKIKKVVTAGTPYWGAPMACKTLYTGNVSAFPEMVAPIMESVMLPIVVNYTGIYELLPNVQMTNTKKWLVKNENQYNNWWNYLLGPDVVPVTYDWSKTNSFYLGWFNRNLVQTAINDHNQIYTSDSYSPMDIVDCTMIVGKGKQTDVGTEIIYTVAGGETINMALSKTSNEGDGTVPFMSATMNRINYNYLSSSKVQKIENFIILDNTEHTQLVTGNEGINQIISSLDEAFKKTNANYSRMTLSSDVVEQSDEKEENYYKLLLAANSDIDIATNNKESYYYHQNESSSGVNQSQNVIFDYAGTFGELPVVMTTMIKSAYSVSITSLKQQKIQFALSVGNKIYSIENFEMQESEILIFSIDDNEKIAISVNGKEIKPVLVVDGEIVDEVDDKIYKDDITLKTMNANSTIQYNNTIYPRILLTNNSDKSIALKDLSFEYVFNADGLENHIYECDWEAINHMYLGKSSAGTFYTNENGNTVLLITFPDSEATLETGKDLELHTRIHTSNWRSYDIFNDYSLGGDNYSESDLVNVLYKGNLVN